MAITALITSNPPTPIPSGSAICDHKNRQKAKKKRKLVINRFINTYAAVASVLYDRGALLPPGQSPHSRLSFRTIEQVCHQQ